MNIAVCIPYRPSHEDRVQNFACVRKEWDQREIPIFTADSGNVSAIIRRKSSQPVTGCSL